MKCRCNFVIASQCAHWRGDPLKIPETLGDCRVPFGFAQGPRNDSFGEIFLKIILQQVKVQGRIPFSFLAHHPATAGCYGEMRHFEPSKVAKSALVSWGKLFCIVPNLDPAVFRTYLRPSGGK